MKLGSFLIFLALISIIGSAWFYYKKITDEKVNSKKQKKKKKKPGKDAIELARLSFHIMTAMIVFASIRLFYLILTHQFQFDYVYRYTSSDLPFGYLISAFWAGQEGSFLLWTLLIAIMGEVFIRSKNQFESHSMLIVSLFQAFFLLILMKASPFHLSGHNPVEGAGLNPLLQNFWMIIHPPILFIGYAAVTFPTAIALTALIKRKYDQWTTIAFPWTLFTSLTLGAGIIIGGYWAYGVLGWGGYWGWDPVENSSLIVWIIILALFHGLILVRRSGALQKTSLALAIISLVFVLYATFLTRSGVLADFSVHSFQDLGINSYLIVGMLAIFGFGLGIMYKKFKEIPYVGIDWTSLNRENTLVVAILILCASAFFTLIGTSSPILTTMVGSPAQVDISFYNKANLPLAIVMSLLLGIAPAVTFAKLNLKALMKRLVPASIFALITVFIAVWLGFKSPMLVLFLALAAWAFWSNMINFIIAMRQNWIFSGAPLAHVGVALLFVGIVVSGVLSTKEQVSLIKNIPQSALGYKMIYRGTTSMPNGKDVVNIDVSNGALSYQAKPRLYMNTYSDGVMREPYIQTKLLEDIYISPLSRSQEHDHSAHQTLTLIKGEKKGFAGYEILFTEFEMGNHEESGSFRVGAKLEFTKNNDSFTVTPDVIMASGKNQANPVVLPINVNGNNGGNSNIANVRLAGMNAETKSISLEFEGIGEEQKDSDLQDQLVIEISEKKFMSILWLGCVLTLVGTFIAIKRRRLELG